MDVVLVFNGLGNQMSQYAFYLSKKEMHQNVRCLFFNTAHNGIELSTLFGIHTQPTIKDRLLRLLFLKIFEYHYRKKRWEKVLLMFNVRLIMEKKYMYQPKFHNEGPKGLAFYHGGWHNPSYFTKIENKLRKIYAFPPISDYKNLTLMQGINSLNSVAIHFRCGDYLEGVTFEVFGKVCTQEYYRNAIQYMESQIGGTLTFYVFSNDFEWVRNFMKDYNCVYVDWNLGKDSWKDMCLMSQCANIIISNSTFCWWAAYLGRTHKKVCRPPYFVNGDVESNVYLEDWIEISNK